MDKNDSQVASFEGPRLFIVELRALVIDGSVWHDGIWEEMKLSLSNAHRVPHIKKVDPKALPKRSQGTNKFCQPQCGRRSRTLPDIMAQ